jgi:hypothetical protein
MAGEPCLWGYWLQTHYIPRRVPEDPELAGHIADHSRMLDEFAGQLQGQGLRVWREFELRHEIPTYNAVVKGRVDCIVTRDSRVEIYDCKTGTPYDSDALQVMLYMYLVKQRERSRDKTVTGALVYRDATVPILTLPESFGSNFDYFVGVLCKETPPQKSPGKSCRFCKISSADCPERGEDSGDHPL